MRYDPGWSAVKWRSCFDPAFTPWVASLLSAPTKAGLGSGMAGTGVLATVTSAEWGMFSSSLRKCRTTCHFTGIVNLRDPPVAPSKFIPPFAGDIPATNRNSTVESEIRVVTHEGSTLIVAPCADSVQGAAAPMSAAAMARLRKRVFKRV